MTTGDPPGQTPDGGEPRSGPAPLLYGPDGRPLAPRPGAPAGRGRTPWARRLNEAVPWVNLILAVAGLTVLVASQRTAEASRARDDSQVLPFLAVEAALKGNEHARGPQVITVRNLGGDLADLQVTTHTFVDVQAVDPCTGFREATLPLLWYDQPGIVTDPLGRDTLAVLRAAWTPGQEWDLSQAFDSLARARHSRGYVFVRRVIRVDYRSRIGRVAQYFQVEAFGRVTPLSAEHGDAAFALWSDRFSGETRLTVDDLDPRKLYALWARHSTWIDVNGLRGIPSLCPARRKPR